MPEIVESEISDTCPATSCIKGRFYIIDRLTIARKTLFVGSARGRPRNRFIRSGWIGIALPVFVFVRSGEGRIKAVFRSTFPPMSRISLRTCACRLWAVITTARTCGAQALPLTYIPITRTLTGLVSCLSITFIRKNTFMRPGPLQASEQNRHFVSKF